MRVVWGHEELIKPWIEEEIGLPRGIDTCRTAAVMTEDGKLAAGVAFHNWNPEAGIIEVSAAACDPRWATRDVLKTLFGYVFSNAQACVAQTDTTNLRTRKLWKGFGAQEYIIPRLRGRTASAAILVLTDDAWANSKFMR